MSWLDTLLSRGSEARHTPAESRPQSRMLPPPTPEVTGQQWPVIPTPIAQSKAPRKPVEIKQVFVQTSPPREGHPGSVVVGYYSVSDGVVQMHDEHGKPLKGEQGQISPIEDARQIAWRLRRADWSRAGRESNFWRPLH